MDELDVIGLYGDIYMIEVIDFEDLYIVDIDCLLMNV